MDTTKNDDAVTENAGFIDYAEVIDNNWLLLVNHLQLDRHHLFSYLRSKGIVDEEDVELVFNAGNTRQKRVTYFLDMIKRKGTDGLNHFFEALQYENPCIYEELTGKKAKLLSKNVDLDSYVLNSIDQSNLYDKLACLTQVHQKIINDKIELEKELIQARNSLKMKEQEMFLREKMYENQRCNTNSESEVLDHNHFVTQLQGKLLELMEERDQLRKDFMDITSKFNECDRENRELKYQCDSVKRESFILQKKVEDHNNEMDSIGKEKIVMKQSLVNNKILREENVSLKKEIEEFRKYGEVLNQKYKIVAKAAASSDAKSPSEALSKLTDDNALLRDEKERLLQEKERLEGDLSVTSQLLKSAETEWNKAIEERDKVRDELVKTKNEVDELKQAVQSHLTQNIRLNERYNNINKKFNEKTLELKKQKSLFKSLKSKEKDLFDEVDSKNESDFENQSSCSFVKRTSLEVLNSIKRNLRSEYKDTPISPSSTMTFEQINLLHIPIPGKEKSFTLPAGNTFSLHQFENIEYTRSHSSINGRNLNENNTENDTENNNIEPERRKSYTSVDCIDDKNDILTKNSNDFFRPRCAVITKKTNSF